jgi:hypothetical protein
MVIDRVTSDQFSNWSDKGFPCDSSERKIDGGAEAQADAIAEAITAAGGHCTRIADRAVQALWQSRMPVRPRPWPWPKVLPVDNASEIAPADGVRSGEIPRTGRGAVGQLQMLARYAGGSLCDQHRTASSQRKVLVVVADGHRCGHSDGGDLRGEHASVLAACRALVKGGIAP